MTVTEAERARLANRSTKASNKTAIPDPTWKAQQAFIRATRRGSKKRSSMPEKLQLLDAATAAIPTPKKVTPDGTSKEVSKADRERADRILAAGPNFAHR